MKKYTNTQIMKKYSFVWGILSLALLSLFICGNTALAASTESDTEEEDNAFSYYFDSGNQCLTITGNGNMSSIHLTTDAAKGEQFVVERPWGNSTAEAKKIESVQIGDGITAIPDGTFANLPNLTSVSLPQSLKSIGKYAFYQCSSLKNIELPDSVQSIGKEAFFGCTKLTSLHFGESLEKIGACAFWETSKLKSITLDSANESFRLISGVLYSADRKTAWLYPAGLTETPQLAPETTSIANGAFAYSKITSIEIPAATVEIGGGSFYNCSKLKNVTFAKKSSCTALDSFNRYNGSGDSMKYGAFQGCEKLSVFTSPASLKSIATTSFIGCTSLKKLKLGKGFRYFSSPAGQKTVSFKTTGMEKIQAIMVASKNTKYFSDKNGCLYLKSSRQLCMKL